MPVLSPQRVRTKQSAPARGHPPPIDGLVEILHWSAQCPSWQRDALRRLCTGAELAAADEVELLAILKGKRAGIPLKSIRNAEKRQRPCAETDPVLRREGNDDPLAQRQARKHNHS